jgi:hypothetical protein
VGDAKIDFNSLRLNYLIGGPIKLSLLDRIAGHVSESGIDMSQVNIPHGSYTIEISIADTKGQRASERQTWNIK